MQDHEHKELLRIKAWHGDPVLKALVVERMGKHRAEDEITQGHFQVIDPAYASGYRGCFIGCMLSRPLVNLRGGMAVSVPPPHGWHEAVEEEFGVPCAIGRLLDRVFEAVKPDDVASFAVAAVDAIPVGASVWKAAVPIILDLLSDPTFGVAAYLQEESEEAVRMWARLCDLLTQERLDFDALNAVSWDASEHVAFGPTSLFMVTEAVEYGGLISPAQVFDLVHYLAQAGRHREDMAAWAAGRVLHHIAATGTDGQE